MVIKTDDNRTTEFGFLKCAGADIKRERFENCKFGYSAHATFNECVFRDCVFSDASFERSRFEHCIFTDCGFAGAHMRHITIESCELTRCNFYGADLHFSEISKDTQIENCFYFGNECPSEGEFTAYKKVCCEYGDTKSIDGAIATLKIPADAKRASGTTNICRCSKAKVVAIEPLNIPPGFEGQCRFFSYYDSTFEYKVGEMVEPRAEYCDDEWVGCASGIHFFMNKEDAINY